MDTALGYPVVMVSESLFLIVFQISKEMRILGLIFLAIFWAFGSLEGASSHGDQPLSRIAIDRALVALDNGAYVKASPLVLGSTVKLPMPSDCHLHSLKFVLSW